MQTDSLEKITSFLHHMHAMKMALRYKGMPNWENTGIERWDSVAEHSYRMALMAVLYHPYIDEKPNLEKTLKMILVHDIVELLANDFSPMRTHDGAGGHAFDDQAYKTKYDRENDAAEKLFAELPTELGTECVALWKEYAQTKLIPNESTAEGRYAYALDKLEAEMQIVDWAGGGLWNSEKTEHSVAYTNEWTSYDPALSHVAQILGREMKNIEK